MAYIYIESKTSNSVVLVLDDLDDGWANGTRTVTWYLGEGYIPSATNFDKWTPGENLENYAGAGGRGRFSGLDPDTQYYVCCEVYHGSTFVNDFEGEFVTDSEYEEPDEPTIDIEKWDWYASNGSATMDEMANSFWALNSPKVYGTKYFSHNVWNDMVAKAWEIIKATTNWWDDTYGSLDDTKFYSEPYELTADMFNSLRNNIELVGHGYLGIGRTGIPRPVYSYDSNYPVKASYFFTLTDYMNECIDNL